MLIPIASLRDSGDYSITNLLLSVFKWYCLRLLGFFPWSQFLFMLLLKWAKMNIDLLNLTKSKLKETSYLIIFLINHELLHYTFSKSFNLFCFFLFEKYVELLKMFCILIL